jgi:hypothetical protein
MADRVYLSLWLRGFAHHNSLTHLQRALERFPFSKLARVGTLRVYALEYREPPVLEERFEGDIDAAEVVAAARHFHNPDCAYELEAYWETMREIKGEWRLWPARVTLACFGPDFESDGDDHIRIDLGPDGQFLPEGATDLVAVRANVRSVLYLANDFRDHLPVDRMSIWSESGENLAAALESALEGHSGS